MKKFAIEGNIHRNHTTQTRLQNSHLIECIRRSNLAILLTSDLQHTALFNGIIIRNQLIKHRINMLRLNLSKIAQMSTVDTQNGYIQVPYQRSCGKKSAITTHRQCKINHLARLGHIILYRRKLTIKRFMTQFMR